MLETKVDNISLLNDRYKLESLGILPDYCLQEIFSREFSNADTAKIAILLSEPAREKLFANLNMVRSEKIAAMIDKFESGALELNYESFENTCEHLMDRVQELKDNGTIRIPETGIEDSFLSLDTDLQACSDSLPNFNLHHMDLHDLISWWDLAAKKMRSVFGKKAQVENIIMERLSDDYSLEIFAQSIDDISDNKLLQSGNELIASFSSQYSARLDMIESFLLAVATKRSIRQLAEDLAIHFPKNADIKDTMTRLGPLLLIPSLKETLPLEDVAMSLYKLKHIYDEQGAEEMLKFTGRTEDHFFRRGLAVVLSGMDLNYSRRIINERKKAQLDETVIKLKMVLDAVTCIRNKVSGYIMLELMSSYTVYDFEE
ncbi:hypothetical protein [Maridesulfovibrio sp. FT414]|uniref:hypothetical protein n=1 Tax=Maridesulfovibrio sp. FT414 TaxID=2979469 RepID=UPI003D8044CF